MADGTEVGKIHLGVEIEPELADGDTKGQLAKISKILEKGLANLKGSFKLKGLDEAFEECFKSMNATMNAQIDVMKESMKAFIADIKAMLEGAKFNFGSISFDKAQSDKAPKTPTRSSNTIRGPPTVNFKIPKITYGKDLEMELMQQQANELEKLMDRLDTKVLNLQKNRKDLINQYRLSMSVGAEKALDVELMELDAQIEKVQNQSIRTNISLKALDEQLASMTGASQASTKIEGVSSTINNVGDNAKITGTRFSGLTSKLSSLLNVAKKMGPTFQKGIKSVGKFATSLLGVGTASKKATNGMGRANMGLSRLIRSFVIFSLIFPLVSQGIRALGQSIGATLMTNDAFAISLDQIKSNLMAAFMPIYNAVLPALNALMSALVNVTAYIATFISSLFGTTYTSSINAAKGMVAAKDAMGAYGSAAKKAAKDANASVMAFDHLNKLNSKNDSDSSGSGVPNIIPTDIDTTGASSLAEKIKKMFADQDYEGIGQLIGEGINKGVAKVTEFIDWNNVGGKITAVIDGFSRIFNSAVATVDWNAAGKMVGTGVNTLANTVKLFFEKINWELLGSSLSRGLNGIVHTVNWRNLGETIGSYLMARINGLYGFVTTADWPGIGKALANGVMGLANYVNWGKFGTLVGTSIQGIVSTVHNFVTNIDWRGLGSKIATSLNNFFSSINWGEFGLTLSDAAHGILNTLRKALADFDFIAIGKDIANFLCNIDWFGLLLDVGVIIGRAFVGLSATIMSGVTQLAQNIVNGFFNGIIEFFSDPFGWIKEHIVDPFINAIKDLFGIHSPSTVMMEIGGYLIQGLLNGIGNLIPNLISNVTSWFGDIGTKISDTWDSVKTWTSETWTNITSNIGGKVSSIKEKISSGFNSAKDAVTTTCSRIKDGVTTKFGEITGWIGGLKDDLWSKATETFNKYLDGVKSIDLKSGIQGVMDDVVGVVGGITSQAATWGSDLMSGMASGIKSASSWVTNAVSSVASNVASWLHFSRPDVGPLREYEKWMPDMMMGLSKTLRSKAPVLMNTVKGIATSVSSAIQDIQPAVAFTGQTTTADQYNNNYISSDDMLISLLKEIIGLLKGNSKGGGTTSTQEIIVKIGDTEMARVVIAAIKKYEKETGRQVLVS